MKKHFTYITLLFANFLFAQTGNYSVQVGAFNQKVKEDYFSKLEGVTYYKDHNDIHRYLIMGISSKNDANAKAEAAQKLGFKAVIIDNDEVAKNCKITCNTSSPKPEPTELSWIFFDFDKADLRSTSKRQLDLLTNILNENPTYTAELNANTDAKGSNEYNIGLSERRANNAKNYVVNKGIKAERIKTSTKGETSPIAKNELNGGKDTEMGRQYNRRVEIKILDASGKEVNMVKIPSIPDSLKQ